MSNEVKLTIRVGDDGSLNVVAKQAKAAAAATDGLTDSTNRGRKAADGFHKGQKGVAGATSNSTKAFSKMNASMGGSSGLVAAYASLAANVFALTAVFGALRRAAQVEQLTVGMSELGRTSGLAMQSLSRGLVKSTGNAISFADAMRSVATVTSAGLDPSTINRFGEAAKNISIVLGRDVSDSFDRLSRGVTKLEPELLDELGLFIRVDEASAKYGQSIGKSAGDLTNFEKRLAFANETLTQAEEKFGNLDESVTSNPYSVLAASFADLSDSILKVVNKALKPIIGLLSQSPEALIAVIGLLGGKVIGGAVASLVRFEGALEVSTKAQKKAATAAANIAPKLNITSKLMNDYGVSLKRGTATLEGFKKAQVGAAASVAANQRLLAAKVITQEVYNSRVANTNQVLAVFSLAQSSAMIATGKGTLALALQALQQGELAMAIGLTRIAMGELSSGILLAIRSMFMAGTATGFFAGALAALRAIAGSTIAIVATLGAAVAIALPVLSLLALALTLGGDLLEWFKRKMATDEENAVTDRLKEMNTVYEELSDNIRENNLAWVGQSQKIKLVGDRYESLFNILATFNAEYSKTIALGGKTFTDPQRLSQLNTIFTDSVALQKALQAEFGKSVTSLTAIKGTDAERVAIGERILATVLGQSRAITGLKDAAEGLTEESKNFIQAITPKTAVTGISAQFQNLVKAIEETERQGTKTADAIDTVFERLSQEDRDMLGISNIVKEAEEGRRVLVTYANEALRLQKVYQDLAMTNPGSAATETARQQYEVMNAAVIETSKSVAKVQLAETKMKKGLFATIRARAKEVKTQETSLIVSKQKQKVISAELGTLREIGVISVDNTQAQIDKSNELKDEKIAAGLTELALLQKIEDTQEEGSQRQLSLAARIREIEAENATLLAEKIVGGEVDVELAKTKIKALQTQQKGEKAILDVQKKQLANRRAIINAQQAITRSLLEVNAARQGRSVTATEEADFAKANLAATVQAEYDAYLIKVQGIDLEYDLLEAQFELLHAEIKLAKEKGTITGSTATDLIASIAKVQTGLTAARALAKGAAGSETVANIVGAVADAEVKRFKAARAVIEAQDALTQERIKSLSAAGRAEAALIEDQSLLSEQRKRIEADLDTEKDKIARLQLELQLEQNINAQIKNRADLRALEVSKRQELGGDFAGGLASLSKGMFDQQEKGGVFAADSTATTAEKISKIKESMGPLIEQMKTLGPNGALVASIAEGSFVIAESMSTAFINGAKGMEGAAQKAQAIADTIGAVNSIIQASIAGTVAEIDKQIAAEKKRDGKSSQSVSKIASMEKKKEAQKKKAFEINKKMMMAQVIMSTAAALASNIAAASAAAIAAGPAAVPAFAANLALLNGITIAMGAAQLALIAGTSYSGGGSIGGAGGASSVSVGERKSSVDMAKSQGAGGELAYMRGAQGQGGPEDFKPAFAGYRNRAEGGNTAFMVGEQGPELFVPERPGRVVANDDIQTGTPINANINISAVDAAGVEDVLMNQRGNIISMIREAANAQGDGFLENINVAEL